MASVAGVFMCFFIYDSQSKRYSHVKAKPRTKKKIEHTLGRKTHKKTASYTGYHCYYYYYHHHHYLLQAVQCLSHDKRKLSVSDIK